MARGKVQRESVVIEEASLHAWLEEEAAEGAIHLKDNLVPEVVIMTLKFVLSELPERSRKIIELRGGINGSPKLSVASIAKRFDMPQPEVCRIIEDSKESMRNTLLQAIVWLNGLTDEEPEPHTLN